MTDLTLTESFLRLSAALFAALAAEFGGFQLGLGAAGLAVLLAAAYRAEAERSAQFGPTTEVAALLTFALGALAMAGHLAASSGVAVNYARYARREPTLAPILAAGVVTAAATMFPRILLAGTLLQPALLEPLGRALGAMAVVATPWRSGSGGRACARNCRRQRCRCAIPSNSARPCSSASCSGSS